MLNWFKRLMCRHKAGERTAVYMFLDGAIKSHCHDCGRWVTSQGRARSWH